MYVDGRVIASYALQLPVFVPRLCLLPLHTHPEHTILNPVIANWIAYNTCSVLPANAKCMMK
jgi:hypothetical protein